MIHSLASTPGRRLPFHALIIVLLVLLSATLLYYRYLDSVPLDHAVVQTSNAPPFPHHTITTDLRVDWAGGGDFDPRDKCPDDFFGAGFVVICKKMADGRAFKFLYHKGKKLLYRIDKDIINGKARIGLHWVTGTHFNAKYRIVDRTFKGGKSVKVPNGRQGFDEVSFQYGQEVSKRRVRPDRELFRETHIDPKQCNSWWDIFNFTP